MLGEVEDYMTMLKADCIADLSIEGVAQWMFRYACDGGFQKPKYAINWQLGTMMDHC